MMMPITQRAFDHPLRSWLRNRSLNTTISSQIQMTNRKNQSIDRKTWPVPKSDARGISSPRTIDEARGTYADPSRRRITPIGVKPRHIICVTPVRTRLPHDPHTDPAQLRQEWHDEVRWGSRSTALL